MTYDHQHPVCAHAPGHPIGGAHRGIGNAGTSLRPGRGRRLWRGRTDDPRWVRPTLLAPLAVTALTYL